MFTKDTDKLFQVLLKDVMRDFPKNKALIRRGKAIFARAAKDSAAAERARQKAEASYAELIDYLDEIAVMV